MIMDIEYVLLKMTYYYGNQEILIKQLYFNGKATQINLFRVIKIFN